MDSREMFKLQAQRIRSLQEMLRLTRCINNNCDDNGVINLGNGEIEQCRFCYDKQRLLHEFIESNPIQGGET